MRKHLGVTVKMNKSDMEIQWHLLHGLTPLLEGLTTLVIEADRATIHNHDTSVFWKEWHYRLVELIGEPNNET